ncbi:MAG: hypothetical protein QM324_06945 [Bacteroidota bacterium]|jgi:F-type H+-transporting ATPase subunit epsilon|nr:hypothetical protein [Bacteroidota bacterium]
MPKRTVDILLEIISPEKMLVHQMVSTVELPGTKGRFMVLRGHAPLISSLEAGNITYTVGDRTKSLRIASGFVEVCKNHVSACVEL